jgi:hypothetical protein
LSLAKITSPDFSRGISKFVRNFCKSIGEYRYGLNIDRARFVKPKHANAYTAGISLIKWQQRDLFRGSVGRNLTARSRRSFQTFPAKQRDRHPRAARANREDALT